MGLEVLGLDLQLFLDAVAESKEGDSFPDESKRVTENRFLIAVLPLLSLAYPAGTAGIGGAGAEPTEFDLIRLRFSLSLLEEEALSSNICAKERRLSANLELNDCAVVVEDPFTPLKDASWPVKRPFPTLSMR